MYHTIFYLNDAVFCNALSITHVYTLFVQKAAMQVLSKTNEDIIKEYFDAMQTEINPSVNYVNTNPLHKWIGTYNSRIIGDCALYVLVVTSTDIGG